MSSDNESSEEQIIDDFPYDNDQHVFLRPGDAVVTYKTKDGKDSGSPTDHDTHGTSEQDIEVEIICARQAATVANLICDAGIDNPIPLPNISSTMLVDIVDLMMRYAKDKPLKSKHTTENDVQTHTELSDVDKEWLEGKDISRVIELIKCVNYLDYAEALSVLEQHVADNIKGKTPEEIRTLFNITNDQTPEQQEQIRAENAALKQGANNNNE